MGSNRPLGILTMAIIQRAIQTCDSVDENRLVWDAYGGDRIRDCLERIALTLDYYQEQIGKYSAGSHDSRRGRPMSRRWRNLQCKTMLWETRPHVCEECGKAVKYNECFGHHKTRIADGGLDDDGNLILLCKSCHDSHHECN
jgi:hypothetical protein